jgi:hypothetical protein
VASRTRDDADDVAAVLHERVDLWMSTTGEPGPEPERISGLFQKASTVPDPDMARALEDRRALIEQRAGEVAREAMRCEEPWIRQLGTPPSDPHGRERWARCAETVAAYRERWGVTGRHVFGASDATSLEQEGQRRLAQRAVEEALKIHRQDQQSVGAALQIGERRVSREGVER